MEILINGKREKGVIIMFEEYNLEGIIVLIITIGMIIGVVYSVIRAITKPQKELLQRINKLDKEIEELKSRKQ